MLHPPPVLGAGLTKRRAEPLVGDVCEVGQAQRGRPPHGRGLCGVSRDPPQLRDQGCRRLPLPGQSRDAHGGRPQLPAEPGWFRRFGLAGRRRADVQLLHRPGTGDVEGSPLGRNLADGTGRVQVVGGETVRVQQQVPPAGLRPCSLADPDHVHPPPRTAAGTVGREKPDAASLDGEFAPGIGGDLLAHHGRAEGVCTVVPGEFLTAPRELEQFDDGVQVLVGAARSRQGGFPQPVGPSGSVPDRPQHLGHRGSPGEFPGGPAEQEPERPDAFGLGAGEGLQQFRPAEALPEQVTGVRVPGPGGKQGPDQRALSHRIQFAERTGQ